MKSKSVVKKLRRSAVSILLSVCMVAFLLPLNVWAEEIRSEEILDGDDSAAVIMEPEEETEVIVEEEIETSRDAFTKELVKGSGTHFYAVYPLAVHYEEENGEEEKTWKEIDNTLRKTEEGYANTAGAWEVALPEDPSAEPVYVTYNGHTLRYSLTELQSSPGEVLDVSLDSEEGSLQAQTIPKGFASAIEYPEALPEGTLRYDLVSHQLKESVVFQSMPETRELTYVLTGEDLSVELNEDNTLSVFFGGEVAFLWEAPYLYDAEGFPCFDVQTTVTATEEGYTVTYSLPEEWLTSEERVFPVTFDPVVHPDILISNTQDQTVFTNKTEPYTWGMVECGRYSGYGVSRCYIKYRNLPALTSADVITRAEMSLYKLQQSTEQAQINVHKVLGAWDDATLNWSNKPAFDPLVEDYRLIYNLGWYTWLITDIARSWYTEGNYGMMFKASDAIEGSTSDNWKQFCSSNYGGTVMPVLYLTFINNCGIESSWDYEETGAGRAGTGYVSDFTGNLVWVRDEMGFSGQRMPVTVERIYNANDKDDNRFGMGYGWRTNFNQLVYQWSTDSSYYVWEDEDGTRQYFKYKSSGTYEDERGTGLILTTTGSGNSKYTITDRQNNKRTFDTNGRLYQIRNNQATVSTITVAYTTTTGKLIDTVTDGAGRIYKFTYSSSLVTNLTFKGSNSGSYYSVNYNYSSYRFMGATYPDGKTISYTYNGSRLLTTATDVDGYKVTYGYSSTAPYRVTSIAVSDDGTQGGTLALSYAHNETTITDHNLNREILQFTDWGNTVCIQDDEGRAVYAEYAEKDTNGDRKKADQMTLDSKLQDTVVNKLASGSFEFGSRWTGASGNPSTGSWTVSTEQHYIGQKSMKIVSSSTTPFMVTPTNALSLTVGKTYTLSAYVLAGNSGAQLRVYTGSTLTAQTDPIASGSSWQRVKVTFTCTNATNTKVYLVNAASGTVYFDCVQLEQSTSAGRYNMIENGDMHYTDSGYTSNAYGWTSTTPALTWGHRETLNESAGALMDSAVYRIYGQADTYVQCHQQVNQGGSAGDCYVFAGWAKGDSVAMGTGRVAKICLILKFRYTDGTDENIRMNFNPDADSTDHWQYGAGRAIAKKDYSAVQVFMCFDYNANTAYFDGIQLFKEEFGNSYVYDSEGRITSVTDLQKQVTSYEYSNNDLVKAVTKAGNTEKAKVTYTYDNYHNVATATTLEGVVTSFTYDTYGNNTKVTRGSVYAQAAFTNSGNTLSTVRDTQGNITTYGYNAQTGVLTYVQRPGENSSTRTNYSYDSLWRNTSVSKQNSNSQTTSNSYTFTDDLLSSLVNGSGTTYTFNNGVFGQTNTVKIGARTLVTNTYSNDRNRYLTKSTYGNGNRIEYTYDSHGRTTKVGYEDNANAILYEFDSEGRLGIVKDNLSGRTRTLLYDLSGRSVGYTEKGTNHALDVTYGYDGLNNVSARTEKLNGTTYTSSYTYDRDSRVTAVSNGTPKAANTYDSLSRLTKVLSKNGNSTVITTNIGYSNALVNSWSNVSGGVTDTYSYTYDSHGNITAVNTTTQYVYDGFDQLVRENNPAANRTWVYTYDNGGNITSKTEYAYTTLADPVNPLSTKTFTYGDSSWKDLLTQTQVDNNNPNTIYTDTIGNMTSDGEWTYTWKHGRQLAGMSKSGTTVSFSYDADGLRTTKTVNGTATNYIYIGGQLTDVTQGNNTLHIDYDSVGPASVKYNGTYYWYLRNAQGDVTGIVNSSGTRVVTYTYDAWGNPLSQSTAGSTWNDLADLNPLRYRGYVYDTETGLYYVSSRYYDPEICRFINADGYASTGQGLLGGNAFAYCLNNPVKFHDNDGTFANWFVGAIVGGIIGGISSAIKGESFWAGAAQGAVSGAIAGAAVDVALICVVSGGLAGVAIGGAVAFVGGAAGNILGEETFSLATTGKLTAVDEGMIKRSLISGAINTVSFGLSATAKCADEGIKLGRASSASTSTAIKQTVKTAIKETFKPRYMDVFSTFSTVHFAVHATLINMVI